MRLHLGRFVTSHRIVHFSFPTRRMFFLYDRPAFDRVSAIAETLMGVPHRICHSEHISLNVLSEHFDTKLRSSPNLSVEIMRGLTGLLRGWTVPVSRLRLTHLRTEITLMPKRFARV